MKSQTFVEPRWLAAIFFGLIFFVGSGSLCIFTIILAVMQFQEATLSNVFLLIFGEAMFIYSMLLYVLFLLPKSFSLLSVSSEKIIWRCPFYRSVKVKIEDCEYVSIEDMAYHNRGIPVIRGDEIAYIYLSNKPFPDKYKHKADIVRRKKGTITFAYSDELCQKLIDILPEDKTKCLVSFYNRMQAADRVNKLKQQNKKKRKSKKK